jgi:hypothetical protein
LWTCVCRQAIARCSHEHQYYKHLLATISTDWPLFVRLQSIGSHSELPAAAAVRTSEVGITITSFNIRSKSFVLQFIPPGRGVKLSQREANHLTPSSAEI